MNDPEGTNPEPIKVRRLMKPKKQRKLAARERRARKTRGRLLLIKLGVFVGVPTALAVIYFAFVASDIYQSTAVIMVQSAAGNTDGSKGGLGAVVRAGSARDSAAIKEYIQSRDMLARLEDDLQVTAHYSQSQADCWSRLAASPTFEETYAHYLDQVEVSFGSGESVLTLKVKAYSAEMARSVAQAIITLSEQKVNTLSARVRDDQIEFAKRAVERAESRITAAHKALSKLREAQPDAAPDPAGSGSETSGPDLESAQLEKTIAEKEYQAATRSLGAATMAATRQSRYLVTIAAPSSPDDATHPKRILGVVTVFLAALAAFGILSLLIAAVREHARV
jgi:capsular polysaccharide transport system permease protein